MELRTPTEYQFCLMTPKDKKSTFESFKKKMSEKWSWFRVRGEDLFSNYQFLLIVLDFESTFVANVLEFFRPIFTTEMKSSLRPCL